MEGRVCPLVLSRWPRLRRQNSRISLTQVGSAFKAASCCASGASTPSRISLADPAWSRVFSLGQEPPASRASISSKLGSPSSNNRLISGTWSGLARRQIEAKSSASPWGKIAPMAANTAKGSPWRSVASRGGLAGSHTTRWWIRPSARSVMASVASSRCSITDREPSITRHWSVARSRAMSR